MCREGIAFIILMPYQMTLEEEWQFKLNVNSFHDLDFADFIIRLDMALSFLQFIKLVSAGCLLKI